MRDLLLVLALSGCAFTQRALVVAARLPRPTTTYWLKQDVVTGTTRQCVYAWGSTVQTRTISAYTFCDRTIEVPQ